MARRKSKTTRRRKKQGISLLGVAETYALLNVATQTAFNVDPIAFAIGKTSAGYGSSTGFVSGTSAVGFRELFGKNSAANIDQVKKNLAANWIGGAGMMIAIPLMFRLGKGLARPAISRTNRLLNKSGVGSTLKL